MRKKKEIELPAQENKAIQEKTLSRSNQKLPRPTRLQKKHKNKIKLQILSLKPII